MEALAAEPEASTHGRRRWDWPRRCGAISIALTLPTLLAGCSGTQSVFDSAGPGAAAIQRIGWIMMLGGAFIFVLVLVLTIWALAAPAARRRWLAGGHVVVAGGIAFPLVVLTALLVYGLALTGGFATPPGDAPLRIAVNGERWWWRVTYLDSQGDPVFETANEVRLPVGQPVQFLLTSDNVIHSFWAPALGGKLDMIPGRETRMVVQAERAGVYRGQCAEYCGGPHALMAFDAVTLEPSVFDAWAASQAEPAALPVDDLAARGHELFRTSGCGACHTIRGTEAAGTIGPDLTHVGSRISIAAGTLQNSHSALTAWIANSQSLKPANLMPSYRIFEAAELDALALYLGALK